jgi:hypothetical protein
LESAAGHIRPASKRAGRRFCAIKSINRDISPSGVREDAGVSTSNPGPYASR